MTQHWTMSRPPHYHGIAAPRTYEHAHGGSMQAAIPASLIKNYTNPNSYTNMNASANANGRVNTIQNGQTSSSTQTSVASSPELSKPIHLSNQRHQQHSISNQWTPHADPTATCPNLDGNSNLTWNNCNPAVSTFNPKGNPRDLSSTEVEDNDDDLFEAREQAVRRLSGACRQCKKLKTKCEFIPELNMCRRCNIKERICVFEGRKKTEHKHEVLLAQLRNKEATIDALLDEIKKRGIVPEIKSGFANSNSTASYKDAPPSPNRETQSWIRKLYERYPSDANNDWTAPSTELGQWVRKNKDSDKDAGCRFRSASASGTGESTTDDVDVKFEEGVLPRLHPILVHHLPSIPVPVGYIADLRRRRMPARGSPLRHDSEEDREYKGEDEGDEVDMDENGNENEVEDEFGIAHSKYFSPGPATDIDQRRFYIEREPLPDMLLHGLLTLDDVDELFKIYFERMNAFVSLLDPVLHTPANTFSRSPFLFTVICAVASRYYTPRRAIYKYAMHLSKVQAGTHLVNGWKTVELCQAYILLSTFSMPAKKWEEDRSRLYLELAIRIALDLNIHRPLPPSTLPNEKYERESLNRTRAWLNCYNLDCSMSTLLGRPAMLSHDIVSPDMVEWYTRSRYNHPYDVHLCAYTEALRLMCRFHEAVRGGVEGKRDLRFYKRVTLDFNDQLDDVHARIAERYDRDSNKNDSGCVFRTGLLPLLINYYRLVMFSFGFQQAVDQGALQKGDIFFQNCFDAACAVVTSMIDILAPMGYMRFSPDGYFVFTAFAAAFLLKLLRTDFAKIVKRAHKDQISTLVRKLIRFLGSTEVAVDEQHTPKLYSRFLAELITRMFPANNSSSAPRNKSVAVGGEKKKVEQHTQNQNGADVASTAAVVHQQQWNEQETVQTELRLRSEFGQGPEGFGDVQYTPEQAHPVQVEPQQYTYPQVADGTMFSDGQQHHAPPQSHPPQYQYQEESNIHTDAFPNNLNVNADVYMTDDTMSLPALTTEEYILSMQAINNPRWWENVMMPGFSWPVHPSTNASVGAEQVHNGMVIASAPVQGVAVESYQYQQPLGQEFIIQGHAHACVDPGGGEQQQVHYGTTTQQQQYPSESGVDAYQTLPVDPSSGVSQFEYQVVGQARSY